MSVAGRRGDAESLLANGNCGVVDRQDLDAVPAQQGVRRLLGEGGITNENRNDV